MTNVGMQFLFKKKKKKKKKKNQYNWIENLMQ